MVDVTGGLKLCTPGMTNADMAANLAAEEWYRSIDETARDIAEMVKKMRDSRRDITFLPRGWYALTEVLIALQSLAYALSELAQDGRDLK